MEAMRILNHPYYDTPHYPTRAWTGERACALARLRARTVRQLRRAEGGIRQALRLREYRLRHRARALHDCLRPGGGCGGARRGAGAVQGSWCARGELDAEPAVGELGSLFIQRSGLAGHQCAAGSDRIRQLHLAQQPRHLRAHRRRRRDQVGNRACGTVYHLATRDEMLPRFSTGEMPKPPARSQ